MTVILKTSHGQQYSLTPERPLHLATESQMQYQLADANSGLAPGQLATNRIGDDLHVFLAGDDSSSPSLILEDFYLQPTEYALTGVSADGSVLPYIPANSDSSDSIHLLPEYQRTEHVLGEISELHMSAATLGDSTVNPFG